MSDAMTSSEDWLRAENWQSVLADPETLPITIRDHLSAENVLTEAALGGQSARADLLQELKACIRDRDDSVPIEDGPYFYWQRYQAGAEHPDVVRQPKTDDAVEVLLCGDRRADGHPYYDLANAEQSPNHRLFAITEDRHGAERYTLTILQAGTEDALEEPLEDLRGDFEWSTDSSAIVYTRLDANQRPSSVWCHTLGTPQSDDHCLLTLDDPGRFIGLGKTSSEQFLTIDIHDHQTTQSYLLPADLSRRQPWPVTAWIEGLEYDIEDSGHALVIKANWGHKDFQLFCCPYPDGEVPGHPETWQCLWTPEPGTLFSDFEILKAHWILEITREGIPQYWIAQLIEGNLTISGTLPLATDIHDAHLDSVPGFDRTIIRLRLSTPRQPTEVLDIDLRTGERTLRKRTDPPNGHHETHYRVERRYAVSSDGTQIPLTLVAHVNTPLGPETPIVLTGYGAYGMSLTPGFSAFRRAGFCM
jgi:oligopeptidase B